MHSLSVYMLYKYTSYIYVALYGVHYIEDNSVHFMYMSNVLIEVGYMGVLKSFVAKLDFNNGMLRHINQCNHNLISSKVTGNTLSQFSI